MSTSEFSGVWSCRYWFPSNTSPDKEESSDYKVTIVQKGDTLVLQSLPNKIEAYILIKLKIDGEVLGGNWQEHTSPHGEFEAAIYTGLVQLLYDKETKRMDGMWVGTGQNKDTGRLAIYSGRWEVAYIGEGAA